VPIKDQPALIPIGKSELLQHGTDVAVIFYGAVLPLARDVVRQLEADGRSVALINARFAKPLDHEMLEKYGRIARVVCTIENHCLMGGFGSAVLEAFDELRITTPVARLGWPDKFIEHATTNKDLEEKYGFTAAAAVARVRELWREVERGQTGAGAPFRVVEAAPAAARPA
jgi:1-deoxy-D-xylulose-5-phosphate synthase